MEKHLTNWIVLGFEEGKLLRANDRRFVAYYHKWRFLSHTHTPFPILSSSSTLFLVVTLGGLLFFRLFRMIILSLTMVLIYFQIKS